MVGTYIASTQGTKWKSQVGITHIAGISAEYLSAKEVNDVSESDLDQFMNTS